MSGKVFNHALDMAGAGPVQRSTAFRSKHYIRNPAVFLRRLPTHQTRARHTVHQTGDPAAAEEQRISQDLMAQTFLGRLG